MKKNFYTAGEIAKISGISSRTIRFYDSKGLLQPVDYSESGYRYYDTSSFETLQKILMFKFLGFSLGQIKEFIQSELKDRSAMKKSLENQKELLKKKRMEIDRLLDAVEVAKTCNEVDDWDNLVLLLNLLSDEKKIENQYVTDANLVRRINIHHYNTSTVNWMDWVYDHLHIEEGMKILEIGCGNGLLWLTNIERLPANLEIFLSDHSEGMLDSVKSCLNKYTDDLEKKNIQIHYRHEDSNYLQLNDMKFDVIIANHMLYHLERIQDCLFNLKKALKKDGYLICSTIGNGHMKELMDLVFQYDPTIDNTLEICLNRFSLQNGEEQLSKLFDSVKQYDYDSNLIVDNADVIWNYVYSFPGNAPIILERTGDKLMKMIKERIEKEGAFLIHKETGLFECRN
jgi:DNA-binding transcriptional MerR regulator/ubiquinone/menaquinone biosynthesis C-methylase UbiE